MINFQIVAWSLIAFCIGLALFLFYKEKPVEAISAIIAILVPVAILWLSDPPVSGNETGGETSSIKAVEWYGTLSKMALRSFVSPKSVGKIVFLNTLDNAPANAEDLSEKENASVLGWMDGSTLYIAGNGGVTAPKDCSFLFSIEEAWESNMAYGHWDQLKSITGIENFDTSKVTDMNGMFCYCRSLTELDLNQWDTSNVKNMHRVFLSCSNLQNLAISKWNTGNVTDMRWLFGNCYSLTTLEISSWDTSNVSDMGCIFYDCNSLVDLDVSNWDISKLEDTEYMFYNTIFESSPPYPFS